MKNKSAKYKKSLITMLIASTVAIAAGGGVFAWFTTQRVANVEVMSLVLGGDTTEATIKYCAYNKTGDNFNGYKSNDSRISGASTFTYDSLFLNAGETERKSLEYAPGYSFTFAIEVIKGNTSANLLLTKYTAKMSDTLQKTTGDYFSLAEALDLHFAVYGNKPTSEELSTYFSNQGIVGEDKFNLTAGTGEDGLATNVPLVTGFNGSCSYILMTLYFSNASSTWYSLDTSSDSTSLAGNGTTNSIALAHAPKGMPSISISDSLVASGSSKNIALSASPYQISSLTLNGASQTLGTDYTVSDNVVSFFATPEANAAIEATYVPYSSEWSVDGQTVAFKAAPLNGSTTNVSYNYELDTYVADPVNGDSNVFEGLGILLNTLTIS